MVSNKSGPTPAARSARKQWMAWLENPDSVKGPQDMTLTIRDMTPGRHKYEARNVQATVSPTEMPDADVLWVRYANGRLITRPWTIKIIKELPEFFPGRPYAGIVD